MFFFGGIVPLVGAEDLETLSPRPVKSSPADPEVSPEERMEGKLSSSPEIESISGEGHDGTGRNKARTIKPT